MICILQASAFAIPLPDSSVQMAVTSPPYYGLRNYAANPQNAFGQEATVADYVQRTVETLREIRRVLKADGVVFWNVADSYCDKSLCLVPQRIAIAAHDDGWVVRDQIIWYKPAPMPESAKDRCTRSRASEVDPVGGKLRKETGLYGQDYPASHQAPSGGRRMPEVRPGGCCREAGQQQRRPEIP